MKNLLYFFTNFLEISKFCEKSKPHQNRIKTASKLRQNCVIFFDIFLGSFDFLYLCIIFFAKCHDFLLIQNVIQQLGDKKNMNSDNILMSLVDMAKEMILLK